MRSFLVAVGLALSACTPKKAAGPTPEAQPAAEPADDAAPEPASDAEPTESDEAQEASTGACSSPDDCPGGGVCQRGIMGEAACTNTPNFMNAQTLCKTDEHCKKTGMCAAFKGSELCDQKLGACTCDGPPN